MTTLRLLDLFSGIGGFSLGLERSGYFETVAFCEIDPFCRRVLAKHWPSVPQYTDVKTLTKGQLDAAGITVDAICGGFPCQDISTAGKGAGLDGGRSGLWFEYLRIIGELRPRVVVIENVSALLSNGMDTVLCGLASLGYDAEWENIPACVMGAQHRRERIWIVANDMRIGAACMDAGGKEKSAPVYLQKDYQRRTGLLDLLPNVGRFKRPPDSIISRNDDGLPGELDRVKACGNAVYPPIAEWIGRRIGKWLAA